LAGNIAPYGQGGQLVCTHNSKLSLGLKNASRSNPDIVVILEGRAKQVLQFPILEDLPPLFIT
jgi:hypothetical protein